MNKIIEKIECELSTIEDLANNLGEQEETKKALNDVLGELEEIHRDLDEQKTEQEEAEQEYREAARDETLRETMATEERHGI